MNASLARQQRPFLMVVPSHRVKVHCPQCRQIVGAGTVDRALVALSVHLQQQHQEWGTESPEEAA